jgi:integrase
VLNRVFGKRLLCEISAADIEEYVKAVATRYTNVTANRSLSVIRAVFSHGVSLGAAINDSAKMTKFLSEKEHVRNRFLLPQDLDRLVHSSRKVKAKYYLPALIYLAAEHGCSRQEALSLKWEDIDFEFGGRGLIHFLRTKNSR